VNYADAAEQTIAFEERIRSNIENLLSRSLGYGKVRAEVSANLDFDHVTTSSESFDPDGQVVRSSQSSEDTSESTSENTNKGVSVSANLPSAGTNSAAGNVNSDKSSRTDETFNYEINKTITNRVKEIGEVKRLSIAVLVDGLYTPNNQGIMTYKPITKEELQKIEALVVSSAGIDLERGDNIEVINMQFSSIPEEMLSSTEGLILGLPQPEFIRIVELAVLAVVSLLVILLVVRPIVMRFLYSTTSPTKKQPALTSEDAIAIEDNSQFENQESEEKKSVDEIDQMITMNQVEGKVRASSVKKVGDIVDKHLEETVSLVRSWLYQEN